MVAIPDSCGGSCLSWSWGADISLTLRKCLSGIMDDKHGKVCLGLSIFAVSANSLELPGAERLLSCFIGPTSKHLQTYNSTQLLAQSQVSI